MALRDRFGNSVRLGGGGTINGNPGVSNNVGSESRGNGRGSVFGRDFSPGPSQAENRAAAELAKKNTAKKEADKKAELKQINDATKANEDQKRKASEAVRLEAQKVKERAKAADKAVSDRRKPVNLVETMPLAPSNIIRVDDTSEDEFGETFDKATTTPKANRAKRNDIRRNRTYSAPIAATGNAAIEAESKRMLAESEQLTALTDKKASGFDEAQETELFAQVTQDQEIDLSNFEDLGYASEQQAYQAYQDMSPKAKSIFDNLHNPSTKQKVGQGLIGALLPGAGLISKLANYVGKSGSMKDQIERAERTVVTLQNNKDNPPINQGQDNDSQPVRSLAATTPPVEPPESTYSGVSAYTEILGNYKF